MDLLDGFKEEAQSLAQHDLSTTSSRYREPQPTSRYAPERSHKQLVFSQSSCLLARHRRVRGPGVQRHEGGSILQVTTALMFVVGVCMGIVQTIPDACRERCGRQHRAAGAQAAGDRRRAATTTIEPRSVSRNRDAQCRVQLRRRLVGGRLPGGADQLQFLHRASWSSSPAANYRGNPAFLKLLSGLYEPDSGEIMLDGARSTTVIAMPHRSLIAAIFVDYHLFRRLYGMAGRTLPRSIGCSRNFGWPTRRALPTVSSAPSTSRVDSASAWRSSLVCWRSVRSCCWTNGQPDQDPIFGASSTMSCCRSCSRPAGRWW